MTAAELVSKWFVEGYAPKKVYHSDHFAMGCKLIADGRVEAGVKMVRDALTQAECNAKTDVDRIVGFVQKEPREAFHLVKPHAELLKLVPFKASSGSKGSKN